MGRSVQNPDCTFKEHVTLKNASTRYPGTCWFLVCKQRSCCQTWLKIYNFAPLALRWDSAQIYSRSWALKNTNNWCEITRVICFERTEENQLISKAESVMNGVKSLDLYLQTDFKEPQLHLILALRMKIGTCHGPALPHQEGKSYSEVPLWGKS